MECANMHFTIFPSLFSTFFTKVIVAKLEAMVAERQRAAILKGRYGSKRVDTAAQPIE